LNIKKNVYTTVFAINPDENVDGLVKLIILSIIKPNKELVIALIATTAYCIPWAIYIWFSYAPQYVFITLSRNAANKFLLQ
jgi:hypothetical protein